jgi:hypothetical protein
MRTETMVLAVCFVLALSCSTVAAYHVDSVSGIDDVGRGLTRETAFATIQYAIDTALDGDTVLVWPGVYNETATNGINFKGKAITVTSADEPAILEVPGFYAVSFVLGEDANSVLQNLIIKGSNTAILTLYTSPTIRNLTIIDNLYGILADNADPNITNCIFWNNTNGDLFQCQALYSFIQDDINEDVPVAHLKFDEGRGALASDSAGWNQGDIFGAQWTSGQINGALSFDGLNDYVRVSDNSTLDFPDEFTLSAWVKPEIVDVHGRIIYRYDSQSAYFLTLVPTAAGKWAFYVQVGGVTVNVQSDVTPAGNEWSHVVGTRSISGELRLYVNGVLQSDIKTRPGAIDSSGHLFIGVDYTLNNDFTGNIDDVLLCDRALSVEEVNEIYQQGLAGFAPTYTKPGFAIGSSDDYHLLSERGRYRTSTDDWVLDKVTSSGVDGGNPAMEPTNEPMPNGGRVNMGAFGNTPYASMSEWPLIYDGNHDGRINIEDFTGMADEWLDSLPWAK